MPRVIGLRAEKDRVHYVVMEGTQNTPKVVATETLRAPASFDEGPALHWYRERIQTALDEHGVSLAALRTSETFLPRRPKPDVLASMFERCRVEGIVIEAVVDRGLDIQTGKMQQISSRMGSRSAKGYTEAKEVRGINLEDYPKKFWEPIIVAISALES